MDQVNHPSHYTFGKIECIDAMEIEYGAYATQYFCLLNAFKYLYRKGNKGPEDVDIRKAQWYIERYNRYAEITGAHQKTMQDLIIDVEQYTT